MKPIGCLGIEGDPRRGKDIFWVSKVEGRETHILLGHGAEGNETHKFWSSQSRGRRNQYSAWVLRVEGEGHFWVFKVEGRETRILLGCGAEGNFEMKPINFGSVKAEGNETNTVFVY